MDANGLSPYPLSGITLATAIVYGTDYSLSPLALDPSGPSPRLVLEQILVGTLLRPPCVIGFSGGRDSSALLALATHLARREGLELPVAATNVFAGDVQATESDWQEFMVSSLKLPHWERFVLTDELDVLGPVARPLVERFGPSFPFNGHFGMPSFALASGGSYLTGVGGDELFEPNDLTALALALYGRVPPRRRYVGTALRQAGPASLRARRYRTLVPVQPWLQPEVSRAFLHDIARSLAKQHLWFGDQIRLDIWRERSREAMERTLSAFGATVGTTVVHPFQQPAFLAAVAGQHRRVPWPSRAAAMSDLFGDVLAQKVSQRRTKASFDTVFFNDYSRRFVQDWDGTGIDTNLVDAEALRRSWSAPSVDARSLSLLQSVWLATSYRPSGAQA